MCYDFIIIYEQNWSQNLNIWAIHTYEQTRTRIHMRDTALPASKPWAHIISIFFGCFAAAAVSFIPSYLMPYIELANQSVNAMFFKYIFDSFIRCERHELAYAWENIQFTAM